MPSDTSPNTDATGIDPVFIDAIHDRLDGRRPGGTSRRELTKLTEMIDAALRPGAQTSTGTMTTRFNSIRATPDGRFNIRHDNGALVSRSRDETHLHLLIESRMQQVDPQPLRHAPAISAAELYGNMYSVPLPGSRAEPIAPPRVPPPGPHISNSGRLSGRATAPAPVRAPVTTPVLDFTDHFNNPTTIYDNVCLDMDTVCDHLHGYSHQVKTISGASSNCWWRAAMLSALLQCDPAALEARVVRTLGVDHADNAAVLRRMGEALHAGGLHTIMSDARQADAQVDLSSASCLKLPWMADREDRGMGEHACRSIVDALLQHGGVPDNERREAVFGHGMGDLHHVATLLTHLECDTVVFHRPWGDIRWGQAPWSDSRVSTLEICAQPNSTLKDLPFDADRIAFTAKMLETTRPLPVLVSRGGHFDLLIPNERLSRSPVDYRLN